MCRIREQTWYIYIYIYGLKDKPGVTHIHPTIPGEPIQATAPKGGYSEIEEDQRPQGAAEQNLGSSIAHMSENHLLLYHAVST